VTPCPASAQSRTTEPSLLHTVGRMRTVSGSREACAKRHGEGHVLLRDGEPHGYAISRRFGRGHVIGPVVAKARTTHAP